MDSRPSELDPYPRAERDLGSAVLWQRSLHRSHRRRIRQRDARRNAPRQKGATLAAGAAILASPVLSPLTGAASASSARPGATKTEVAQKAAVSGEKTWLLSYGDTGEAVAAVQAQLRIPADGIFGPQTEGAVKTFQINQGLAATGIVDAKTWAEIFGTKVLFYGESDASASASSAGAGESVNVVYGSDVPDAVGGPDVEVRDEIESAESEPAPAAPETTTEQSAPVSTGDGCTLRRANGRAGQRHGHRLVRRGPRRPHAQRHRHRGADRHHGAGRRVRHGQRVRHGERLRHDGLHPPCGRDHHVLRPSLREERRRERVREGRPEDRRGRLHRQLHRAARALRGPAERRGRGCEPVPAGQPHGGRRLRRGDQRADARGRRRDRRRDAGSSRPRSSGARAAPRRRPPRPPRRPRCRSTRSPPRRRRPRRPRPPRPRRAGRRGARARRRGRRSAGRRSRGARARRRGPPRAAVEAPAPVAERPPRSPRRPRPSPSPPRSPRRPHPVAEPRHRSPSPAPVAEAPAPVAEAPAPVAEPAAVSAGRRRVGRGHRRRRGTVSSRGRTARGVVGERRLAVRVRRQSQDVGLPAHRRCEEGQRRHAGIIRGDGGPARRRFRAERAGNSPGPRELRSRLCGPLRIPIFAANVHGVNNLDR